MIGAKALIIGGLVSAVVITALWYRGSFHAERAKAATAALDRSIEVSNSNAENAKHYAAEADRFAAELTKNAETKNAIRQESDTRRREVIAAPAEDDGPIAPVLRRWLDGLPVSESPVRACDPALGPCPATVGFADLRTFTPSARRDAAERRLAARRLP